jgi:alpha-beta hydrolase superfamily lysophospholipase
MSSNLQKNTQVSVVIPAEGLPGLHATLWTVERPRAVLVIAHGVGEHGGCYSEVAASLQSAIADLEILAVDLRGHGRSPGLRGYVGRYEELIGDLRSTVLWVREHRPNVPVFVLGHSNGGQLALRLALTNPGFMAGLIVSNPASRLALQVPWWKLAVGRVLYNFAPRVTLHGNLKLEQLTRDPSQYPERLGDPLRHGRVSAPLFFGMVEGGEKLAEEVKRLKTPLLLILGTADPIIDPEATKEIFENVGSSEKQAYYYADSLHEPLNDLDRDQVIADLAGWLRERMPG